MFRVTLTQNGYTARFSRIEYGIRTQLLDVAHCATVDQAVRTAQRQYPGWTCVAVERVTT